MRLASIRAGLRTSVSTPGVVVLALAFPLLFLAGELQPAFSAGVGSTEASVYLADLAVLAVAAAALVEGRRRGFEPLRRGLRVLFGALLFLVAIAIATIWPALAGRDYDFLEHALTAAKVGEYALLAVSVPLLVRTNRDLALLLVVAIAWATAAAVVAVLQFFDLAPADEGYQPGGRQPAFLGSHDLAALAGAVVALALGAIALGDGGRLRAVAAAAGAIGLVLSGAIAGVLGAIAAGAAALLVAARRGVLTAGRALAVAAILAVIVAGVVALRAANIEAFLRFIGVEPEREAETFGGESYVQRLALLYIGGRAFLDHPVTGVGWQGMSEEYAYGPYVDDARRRFPKLPELSLPSPEHPWGVQNAYVQAFAELGGVGGLVFLAMFVLAGVAAFGAAARAPPDLAFALLVPILWLLVAMGVWLGIGLVAGTPLGALTWLSIGLAAAAPSWHEHE
jgi:O-antigen ligase